MRRSLAYTLACATLMLGTLVGARADSVLNKILPAVAGTYAVTAIARPLNGFINGLLASNGFANRESTKVVPILTLGSNTYIGAAQVTGSNAVVNRIAAVVAFKGQWNAGVWTVDALVPVDSIMPGRNVSRVYGAGVDAVINARL